MINVFKIIIDQLKTNKLKDSMSICVGKYNNKKIANVISNGVRNLKCSVLNTILCI